MDSGRAGWILSGGFALSRARHDFRSERRRLAFRTQGGARGQPSVAPLYGLSRPRRRSDAGRPPPEPVPRGRGRIGRSQRHGPGRSGERGHRLRGAEPRRQRQQRRQPRLGPGRHELLAGRAGPLRRRRRRSRSPARTPRYVSNRVFNDVHQNVFSERGVTQWGFVWGQFLDHTFGLRERPARRRRPRPNIPFNAGRPAGGRSRNRPRRHPVHPVGGRAGHRRARNPRQQINTVSSLHRRLRPSTATPTRGWTGCATGPSTATRPTTAPRCCCRAATCRAATARGNAATAPAMDDRRPAAAPTPNRAVVAGDVRANENIAPDRDPHAVRPRAQPDRRRCCRARCRRRTSSRSPGAIVIAEQQYITYTRVPARDGRARCPRTRGYKPNVNATLSQRVRHRRATGRTARSTASSRSRPTPTATRQATLDALEAQGVEVAVDGDDVELAIPLNVAFFNPDLLEQVQLGPMLQGIGLRVAVQATTSRSTTSCAACCSRSRSRATRSASTARRCRSASRGVVDLGAIDIERGRDHGMPTYNQLRAGLRAAARRPRSPRSPARRPTSSRPTRADPGQRDQRPQQPRLHAAARHRRRRDRPRPTRTPIEGTATATCAAPPSAARLRAIYGNVNNIDAFIGMVAEPHVPGTEFGELQLAIWTRQFQRAARRRPVLLRQRPGPDAASATPTASTSGATSATVIAPNTDIPRADLAPNVFFADGDVPPASCRVQLHHDDAVARQLPGRRSGSPTPAPRRSRRAGRLRFAFANGQQITQLWDGVVAQDGVRVPVSDAGYNADIPPGASRTFGFNATRNDAAPNSPPTRFSLNTTVCARG